MVRRGSSGGNASGGANAAVSGGTAASGTSAAAGASGTSGTLLKKKAVAAAPLMSRVGRVLLRASTTAIKGAAIGYCVFEFCVEVTHCTGPSMEPTIQNGDFIVVEKLTTLTNSFKRGDIVVCRSPTDPQSFLCKRLVGLPGDILTSSEIGCQTVPKGNVWLQGDNYVNSHDSRNFGSVPIGLLKGRAVFKLNTWKALK